MAALPTIQETINIGKATMYLMGNDIAKGSLYGKRLPSWQSPVLVGLVTDALKWQYETSPADETLRGTANYLIWLCGNYGVEARGLSGGGTVTPITPGTTAPQKIEFYVNATDSYILDGGNTFTLPVTWTGYDLLVFKNGIEQTLLTDGTDSFYAWNSVTRVFTIAPVAATGDKFSIAPN